MALSVSYVGTTTEGASSQTPATNTAYVKRVSLTGDTVLASVGAFLRLTSGSQLSWRTGVWADNDGAPGTLMCLNPQSSANWFKSSDTDRWMETPVGFYVASSAFYWIGIHLFDPTGATLAYDSSGSDYTIASGSVWTGEAGALGVTASAGSNDYSLRGAVVSW